MDRQREGIQHYPILIDNRIFKIFEQGIIGTLNYSKKPGEKALGIEDP